MNIGSEKQKNAETLYFQELKAFSALAFCAAIETQLSAFSRWEFKEKCLGMTFGLIKQSVY